MIFQLTLDDLQLALPEGGERIQAGMDLTIDAGPVRYQGRIDASGGIRYESAAGAFFLTDPVVDRVAVEGISGEALAQANTALTAALQAFYAENPFYVLEGTDTKRAVAKLVLKEVTVENKELVLKLGI